MAKLVHPNIVRYFAAWVEEDDADSASETDDGDGDEFSGSEPSILRPSSSFLSGFGSDSEEDGFEWERLEETDSCQHDSTEKSQAKRGLKNKQNLLQKPERKSNHQLRNLTLYIVMEYVPRTIRALIDAKELVGNENKCYELLHETLEALSCVHELKIIHQDIKPENLLIDAQGKVKLGDFGLAVEFDESS